MMNEKKKARFQQVRRLASEGRVEIVAHFFQRDEVKEAAGFVGGAYEVVEKALSSQAPAVMVCGASFMIAEIERRGMRPKLLVPRRDLSCPLAEAVTVDEVIAAKKEHPAALLVADLKVAPELRAMADLLITSATAGDSLAALKGRELIMLPGSQLADCHGFGAQVVKRWAKAVCQVHELALPEDVAAARAAYPAALVAAHFLTRPEVRAMADFVGDSAAIGRFCGESVEREFIVISESGLASYLSAAFPDKVFHETEAEIFCPNMKLTTLKTMADCLTRYMDENREPQL